MSDVQRYLALRAAAATRPNGALAGFGLSSGIQSAAGAVPGPDTIASLALWVDGRSSMYSDSGGTVQADPYAGRVRRVNYPTPLSGNAQAASDPLRPWREPNALNFQFGAHHKLAATATAASNWADCTIALSFRLRDQNTSGALALIANSLVGLAGGIGVRVSNANYLSIDTAGSWTVAPTASPTAYAACPTGARCSVVVRSNATGLRVSLVVDGARTDYTKTLDHYASATTSNWTIGSDVLYGTSGTHAAMAQPIVVSRSVSDAENDALIAWLEANPAPDFPAAIPLVLLSGDSIAYGLNLDRSLCWGYKAQQSINAATPNAPINMTNVAVSGDTIAAQQAAYSTRMAQFLNPSRVKNIFLAAIGTNNMATLGQDGPTALALYYAYLDDKLARGWIPVPCMILPRNAGGAFETARTYFNMHLEAEWAARGYARPARVHLVAGMGAAGDWANTTNYQDTIHPTLVGNDLLEPEYRAAIQAAIAM